jgi:hypothetical protein
MVDQMYRHEKKKERDARFYERLGDKENAERIRKGKKVRL